MLYNFFKTGRKCLLFIAVLLVFFQGTLSAKTSAQTREFNRGWAAYDAQQYNKAFKIWRSLAEQGHLSAQINLGALYDSGNGVNKNPSEAIKWYQTAALQGSSAAQYNLALMVAENSATPANLSKAAEWMRKAAEQEFAEAEMGLGRIYTDGTGVVRDPDMAIEWYYKAGQNFLARGDMEGARSALEAIRDLDAGHALGGNLSEKIQTSAVYDNSDDLSDLFMNASIGTAWPISCGYVVTNNHLISNTCEVTLIDCFGEKIQARAVLRNKKDDIALLEVTDSKRLPPALPLASSQANLGASVFTIGFPRVDVMGKSPKLSEGIISSINGLRDNPCSYQTTVPIQPGNSGGPLINMKGEVVGLVTSMIGVRDNEESDLVVLQNASYVTKAERIQALLGKLTGRESIIRELPCGSDTLEALAARIQGSVLTLVAR